MEDARREGVSQDESSGWELVRDRRRPSALILLALLTLLTGVAVAISWQALTLWSEGAGSSSARERNRRIRQAQAAYDLAPVASAASDKALVQPTKLQNLDHDEARLLNASIPFSRELVVAARPFAAQPPSEDLRRATDCLAAAVWYEAGDDAVGERAVAQVVINRLRHPAFPKSVCDVVFQGSNRQTGCQFSFTCDGAMQRRPSLGAWTRARQIAGAALGGYVFAPVGYATHYHTDWVAPYWSAKVDKIAQVGTHLFFRWLGPAGRGAAFTGQYAGKETLYPRMVQLALLSGGEIGDTASKDVPVLEPVPLPVAISGNREPDVRSDISAKLLRGNSIRSSDRQRNSYNIDIAADAKSGQLALMALDICSATGSSACEVHGRLAGSSKDRFYYFRDPSRNFEIVQWDCQAYVRPAREQCMPGTARP